MTDATIAVPQRDSLHVHGILNSAWMVLFVVQAALIGIRKPRLPAFDLLRRGAIHAAYVWGGSAIVLWQAVKVLILQI